MKIVLRHTEGSRKGREDAFEKARIRVGRDPANDLAFDPYKDRDASAFHAELWFEEGMLKVKDLGSTNGTWLNGKRVEVSGVEKGDILNFGKHGPVVEISDLDPSGSPAASDGELPGRGAVPAIGTKTMGLIVRQAMGKAREKGGVAGGTMFLREMVRQTVQETSARQKRTVALLVVLLLAAACIIGFQVYASWHAQKMHDEDLARMNEALERKDREISRQKDDLLSALEESMREQEQDYVRRRDEQMKLLDQEAEKYRKDLDEARKIAAGDREKIAKLERMLSRMTGSETLFKAIQKKYDPSVVLVYAEFKVRDGKGGERLVGGFGTGFIVSEDGLVVTNKHVVQPWKFSQFAFKIQENGETFAGGDAMIAAWCAGSRVYVEKDGKVLLNLEAGYENLQARKLKLVRTAPDNMRWVTRGDGDGEKESKVWAHEPADNNDLALLKITDSRKFVPVPLMSPGDFAAIEKLDRVMVLGFPRGGSILERGIAETSPALGHVRKIESTIHISAPITQGNSGGPVFAQSGEVIGISTRMIKDVETYGLCIPVSEARKLMQESR